MTDHPERVIRYFEDYVPGLVVDCGAFSLDEGEIIAFAKEYDPQPFHVDPVAAEDGPFGGLIASGWQTTSKLMRLLVEHFVSPESGLGAVGVDEIRWPRPVRPGDTLHARATVLEARRSNSKPDRGIVRSLAELINQDGDLAMKVTAINFVLLEEPGGLAGQRRPRSAVAVACSVAAAGHGDDDRVRLGAVAVEFGLEQRPDEERVPGEFRDPDLPAVVEAAEPQPALGQSLQVGRVQAVVAVVALGPAPGAGYLRGAACPARS